jgi:hypothetical protein
VPTSRGVAAITPCHLPPSRTGWRGHWRERAGRRGARTALAPEPSRVLGSDPHAFAGLYIRHRSSFTSHARRYLRDPRDADEVVQEAFLRLFLALPELETELQALAYCRRTITNLCIDRYRADARAPGWSPSRARRSTSWLTRTPATRWSAPRTRHSCGGAVAAAGAAPCGPRQARDRGEAPPRHRRRARRRRGQRQAPALPRPSCAAQAARRHRGRARRRRRAHPRACARRPAAPPWGRRPAPAALLGLGSGPDLRAVPVVGVDLPDVLGVTTVADAVGDAVRRSSGRSSPATTHMPRHVVGRPQPSDQPLAGGGRHGHVGARVDRVAARQSATGAASGGPAVRQRAPSAAPFRALADPPPS